MLGTWSKSHARKGLKVHPGIERTAVGRGYGDLFDNQTFRDLAHLAHTGSVKEWHAAPPCWSFGTLRRPRLRSKTCPAGFNPEDKGTREQTLLAVRTAFILFLAFNSGSYISCEQPGGSVMFQLQIFRDFSRPVASLPSSAFARTAPVFRRLVSGCATNPGTLNSELGGVCSCPYKGRHFTVQGTFTKESIDLFESRCRPSSVAVYGRTPRPGEAVRSYSASYPIPLCEAMSAGSLKARQLSSDRNAAALKEKLFEADSGFDREGLRAWHDAAEWVEDVCESVSFRELFRYRFKKSSHINCLECRVYKSWLKHASKSHPRC